jgi:tight adherence protein B
MTFILLFLGFFGVFFLVLYGLGIIRVLPKSLKILERKQTSADKNSKNNPNPLLTAKRSAKMRVNVSEDDDSSLMQRLDDLLFMAGIQMPFGRFLAITFPIGLFITFVLFKGASFSLPIALPMGFALWLMGVNLYLKRKQKKRRALFEKDFPDVVATIARAISVGASLQESFRIVCEEFPGPIQDEFNRMRQDILFGRTAQHAITQAADRLQLQDFDFFALSVVTQIESGGNLGKSLDSLRETIVNRQMLIRQLKVKTAGAKFQSRFFIGLPIVVGTIMYFMDRQNVMYFVSPEGEKWGLILLGMLIIGIFLIQRMNKKALDG